MTWESVVLWRHYFRAQFVSLSVIIKLHSFLDGETLIESYNDVNLALWTTLLGLANQFTSANKRKEKNIVREIKILNLEYKNTLYVHWLTYGSFIFKWALRILLNHSKIKQPQTSCARSRFSERKLYYTWLYYWKFFNNNEKKFYCRQWEKNKHNLCFLMMKLVFASTRSAVPSCFWLDHP